MSIMLQRLPTVAARPAAARGRSAAAAGQAAARAMSPPGYGTPPMSKHHAAEVKAAIRGCRCWRKRLPRVMSTTSPSLRPLSTSRIVFIGQAGFHGGAHAGLVAGRAVGLEPDVAFAHGRCSAPSRGTSSTSFTFFNAEWWRCRSCRISGFRRPSMVRVTL